MSDSNGSAIKCERDVVTAVSRFLRDEGYRVRMEVPNMGQSADLMATKNRWLTAIEAKVHYWQGALAQCRAHELVADFVCVAVATKGIPPDLLVAGAQRGYGIIHCRPESGVCGWIRSPDYNGKVWPGQRERLSQNLRGIPHVA